MINDVTIWRFGLKEGHTVTNWKQIVKARKQIVWKQIVKATKFLKTELLNNQRKKENEDKLVLNITYHLSLAQLKIIMTRIQLLLTPDNVHNRVFRDVPVIGFCRAKILKDILVRVKIPQISYKG